MCPMIRRWSFRLTALFTPLLVMGCHDDSSSTTRGVLEIIGAVADLVIGIIRVST